MTDLETAASPPSMPLTVLRDRITLERDRAVGDEYIDGLDWVLDQIEGLVSELTWPSE